MPSLMVRVVSGVNAVGRARAQFHVQCSGVGWRYVGVGCGVGIMNALNRGWVRLGVPQGQSGQLLSLTLIHPPPAWSIMHGIYPPCISSLMVTLIRGFNLNVILLLLARAKHQIAYGAGVLCPVSPVL